MTYNVFGGKLKPTLLFWSFFWSFGLKLGPKFGLTRLHLISSV